MDYLKYYWLERDFFPEIYQFFQREGYLKPDQFFSIITWKSIRPRKQIRLGFLVSKNSFDEAIRNLTEKINKAQSKEEKLELLIGNGKKIKKGSSSLWHLRF